MDLTQNEFIEVADAGRKGKGVFAKVNIPLGTRVMPEPALIDLQLDDNGGFTSMQILQAFALLTPFQQVSFLELSGFACPALKASVSEKFQNIWENIPELQRDVISIFRTNAFDGMLFLTNSRINHSCIPNLIFAYNPIIGKETFHAIRDIWAGEELTIMYIDGVNCPRKRRRADLLQWGLVCDCPACENTPEGNLKEKRRVELFIMDQVLAIHELNGIRESTKGALRLAQKMAGIQKSEGLVN